MLRFLTLPLLFLICLKTTGQSELSNTFIVKAESALENKDWKKTAFFISKSTEYNGGKESLDIKYLKAKFLFQKDSSAPETKEALLDFLKSTTSEDPRKKKVNDLLVKAEIAAFEATPKNSAKSPTTEQNIAAVPFAIIEEVPTYKDCKKTNSNEDRKKCMNDKISAFINKNFNTGIADDINLTGIQKVFVSFKIDKTGSIINIKSKGTNEFINMEAERVVSLLPKMIPGKQKGKPVGVLYSLPITFSIAPKDDTIAQPDRNTIKDSLLLLKTKVKDTTAIKPIDSLKTNTKKVTLKPLLFSQIDTPPLAPGCDYLNSNSDKKRCFSSYIKKWIITNTSKNNSNKKQRCTLALLIKKDGTISKVETIGAHPNKEKVIKSKIMKMPKFEIGAMKENREVDLLFKIPITL